MVKLNDEQEARVDEIESAAFEFCKVLTECYYSLEWDEVYIKEIAEAAAMILTQHGYKVRYPAIVEGHDIGEHVEEYFS